MKQTEWHHVKNEIPSNGTRVEVLRWNGEVEDATIVIFDDDVVWEFEDSFHESLDVRTAMENGVIEYWRFRRYDLPETWIRDHIQELKVE